jgi:lipopolysaccharide export LptBFGC system permease protein LptF
VFLWFIFGGYVSGIGFKLAEYAAEGRLNPVIGLYLFNFFWVAAEVILYYRYRRKK